VSQIGDHANGNWVADGTHDSIGIVYVACFAASVAGVPQVRIRSTGRVTFSFILLFQREG
jgi:hypothetical protein